MGIALKRIFNGGIQRRPFKAFKRYEVTDVNYSSSFEISVLRGISDNNILTEVSTSVDGEIAVDTFLTSSGGCTDELNKRPQKIIWNGINSTFFKRRNDIRLFDTASIVSIPQNKFGDAIKPKSVVGFDNSHNSTVRFSDKKKTHEYGLLIANELTSSTFIKSADVILDLKLDGRLRDESGFDNIINNVNPRKYTFTESDVNIGKVVTFKDNKQSIVVNQKTHLNAFNNSDNWAVSFWANIPTSQSISATTQTLIQKRTSHTYVDDLGTLQTEKLDSTHYPFDLGFYTDKDVTNAGKLILRASDGNRTLNITSSTSYNDGEFHHYVVSKTGSNIILYVDAESEASSSYNFAGSVTNDRDVLIGSDTPVTSATSNFSGSIGQLRLHKSALTEAQISSLADNSDSGSALQKTEIGYVFYHQGVIVVTDPRPRYQNIFLGDGDWNYTSADYELNYRSSKTVEEVSILCELKRNEFNVSQNPSLRLDGTDTDYRLKTMVTGSDFRPYITQIGLYNDEGQLLAVGKLGSPLKKRRDVDVTINVKFDID